MINITGKWYSFTIFYKDGIAVYTCDHRFLNFLRCMSQSRRIKETRKIRFFIKTRNGKLIVCNKTLIIFIYFQVNLLDAYINQDKQNKHEKKSFKTAKRRCNGKIIIMYFPISKCFMFCCKHKVYTRLRLC